jgi:hypothetical protein
LAEWKTKHLEAKVAGVGSVRGADAGEGGIMKTKSFHEVHVTLQRYGSGVLSAYFEGNDGKPLLKPIPGWPEAHEITNQRFLFVSGKIERRMTPAELIPLLLRIDEFGFQFRGTTIFPPSRSERNSQIAQPGELLKVRTKAFKGQGIRARVFGGKVEKHELHKTGENANITDTYDGTHERENAEWEHAEKELAGYLESLDGWGKRRVTKLIEIIGTELDGKTPKAIQLEARKNGLGHFKLEFIQGVIEGGRSTKRALRKAAGHRQYILDYRSRHGRWPTEGTMAAQRGMTKKEARGYLRAANPETKEPQVRDWNGKFSRRVEE